MKYLKNNNHDGHVMALNGTINDSMDNNLVD